MSSTEVTRDADDLSASPRVAAAPRRSLPAPPRVPLPLAGALVYAGIRLLGVALVAIALQHGRFRGRHWTLLRWTMVGDAGHYRAIVVHGYSYQPSTLAHVSVFSFFPGFPAAIRAVAWLPGISVDAAGLIVVAIAGLAAAWGLVRLGLKLTGDARISLLLVAVWAVAPSSAVLAMMYAEALFCALAVWALAALVDRRWLTAGVLTLLAGTVRSTALALIAAVGVAALAALMRAARDRQPASAYWRPLAAAVMAPLGLAGFLTYVAVATGRPDGWFWVERHSFHMTLDWGASTLHVVRGVFTGAPSVAQILVALALLAAVGLTVASLFERIPFYLHVYTLVVVVIALATSANWIGSKPRFLLPAVLLALPVARLLAPVRTVLLVPLFALLTGLSVWFSLYLVILYHWVP